MIEKKAFIRYYFFMSLLDQLNKIDDELSQLKKFDSVDEIIKTS